MILTVDLREIAQPQRGKKNSPAQVYCARVQPVKMIVLRAQSLAELALDRALCVLATMLDMGDITRQTVVSCGSIEVIHGTYLAILQRPSHENLLVLWRLTLERLQGYESAR